MKGMMVLTAGSWALLVLLTHWRDGAGIALRKAAWAAVLGAAVAGGCTLILNPDRLGEAPDCVDRGPRGGC